MVRWVGGSRRGVAAVRQWAYCGWPRQAIAPGAAVRRVRVSDVALVQREFSKLLPPGTRGVFRVTSVVEGQGERAVRPESVAAGTFGLIAALTALVLASQAIRRTILSS